MPEPLEAEVARLAERLKEIERELSAIRVRLATERPTPAAVPVAPTPSGPGGASELRPEPLAFAAARRSRAGPRVERDLESFLGGRVMLVAGIVVVLFGVAFFLRWAIVHGWLGPGARVAMAVVTGLAALVAGERLRSRGLGAFGQALMGGGLGALFLAVYFSAVHYGFIGRPVAFALAAALTLLGAALAVSRGAPLLAHLAFLGGFLAPALLGHARDAIGPLTGWLLLLDLGVLMIALIRPFAGLEVQCALAAVYYFLRWPHDPIAHPDRIGLATAVLLALVAAQLVLVVVPPIVRREPPRLTAVFSALIAGSFLTGAGNRVWVAADRRTFGAALIGVGVVYLAGGRLLARRVPDAESFVATFLLLALAALAVAIAVLADGLVLPVAYAVTGLATVVSGAFARWPAFRVGGIALLALGQYDALVRVLARLRIEPTPFLNAEFIACAVPSVAFLVAAALLRSHGSPDPRVRAREVLFAAAVGLVSLLLAVTAEIYAWGRTGHPRSAQVVVSITWALAAGALIAIGFGRKNAGLRWAGLALFAVTLGKVFFVDTQKLDIAMRVGVFLALGVLLVLASFLYQRRRE